MTRLIGCAIGAFRLVATLVLLAAGAVVSPLAASGPMPASIEEIEALCPSVGATNLGFGRPREEQDQEALAAIEKADKGRLFHEGRAEFSLWSDRLYALSWYTGMAEDELDDSADWPLHMARLLEEGGWQAEQDYSASPAGFSPWPKWRYSKSFEVDGQARQLQVTVEMLGNFALECSDVGLANIAELESVEILEPGSPRPVPKPLTQAHLPDPSDCDNPDIQDMFSTIEKLEAAGHRLEQVIPVASASSEAARFGERMRTWLRWRMLDSGKFDQEQLWQIEEDLDPDAANEKLDDLTGFLEGAGQIMEAQKRGDGATVCRLFISLFSKQRDADAKQALRWTKLNAALEAEARRRGVAVD